MSCRIEGLVARVLTAIVFLTAAGASWAQQHQTSTLSHDGYDYTYESVPVYDKGDPKPAYYTGRITVRDAHGKEIYRGETYEPGCVGKVPPIGVMTLPVKRAPLAKAQRTLSYVAFCGNAGVRHDTLTLFHAPVGVVAVLDFLSGPATFEVSPEGEQVAVVIHEVGLPSLQMNVSYRVLYRFDADAAQAGFTAEPDAFVEAAYRRYIDENLGQLTSQGKLDSGVRALLAAIQIKDVPLYQRIKKELEQQAGGRAASLMKDLEADFSLPP